MCGSSALQPRPAAAPRQRPRNSTRADFFFSDCWDAPLFSDGLPPSTTILSPVTWLWSSCQHHSYAMLCIKLWEFDGDLLTNNVEFLCVHENISPGKLVFRGHTGNSFLSGTLSHVFSCSLGATLPQKLSPMGHQSKQTSTTSKTSATSLSVFSGKKKETSWKKPRM